MPCSTKRSSSLRPPENPSLRDLDAAHVQLMKLYGAALRHAEALRFFVKRIDVEIPSGAPVSEHLGRRTQRAAMRPLTLRFLVRPFVSDHIANRMRQLRNQYQWNQQTLPREEPARVWFAERQQELEALSKVPSWNLLLPATRLLAGPATAALLIYLGGNNLWQALFGANLSQLGTLAFIAVVMIIYPSIPFSASFAYKRALFLGGPDHPTTNEALADSPENIYATEDSLWSLLAARKTTEPSYDRIWLYFFYFLFALTAGVMAVVNDEERGFYVVGAAGCLVCGLASLWAFSGRRYR
jgi:hypothetical protein